MIRPNNRRLKRIALIMIVVSIVLFSVSVYLLSAGTSEYNVSTNPAKTSTFYKNSVGTGDDLTYKISFQQSVNLTASLISPSGSAYSELNYTRLPTGPNNVIAPESGNWTFQLLNKAAYAVNVSVIFDNVNYNDVSIAPFKSTSFQDTSVKAQDQMTYTINLNQKPNIQAELVSPTGVVHSWLNLSATQSGSNTIIAPNSGSWNLQITNNGSLPVNLSVTIGDTSYLAIGVTVFGFVLLPGGIALLLVYANSVRMEKKRKRLRDISQ